MPWFWNRHKAKAQDCEERLSVLEYQLETAEKQLRVYRAALEFYATGVPDMGWHARQALLGPDWAEMAELLRHY